MIALLSLILSAISIISAMIGILPNWAGSEEFFVTLINRKREIMDLVPASFT